MNNMKQFLIDSIANDFAQQFEKMPFETQQQMTLKLAEMYVLFGEVQKAHELVVALRTAEAQMLAAHIYRQKGDTAQAAYTYFKAFADTQTPEAYEKLADLFAEANMLEDAAYYAQLAYKLTAYKALTAFTDDEALVQAEQMMHHPKSFDGWLQSVLRLNEESLATYAEQVTPVIEEKRPKRKPTLKVTAGVQRGIARTPEQPPVPNPVVAPTTVSTEPVVQQPIIQQPLTEQPSPYVDPAAFIAAQRANQETEVEKSEETDLNDFESMYFGEMYDED